MWISESVPQPTDEFAYVLLRWFEVAVYFLLLSALLFGLVRIYRLIHRPKPREASTGISTSTIVAAGPVVDEKSTPVAIGNEGSDKALVRLLTISVDVIAVSLFIVLFSYSFAKLGVEVFDFKSFDGSGEMSMSLTFAWMFSSTTTICLFLLSITRPPEQLTFDIFKQFTDPAVTSGLLSGLIIPVLLALFAFGTTIFPRIPFSMGGGEPREVTMKTKISQDPFEGKRLFLLGESSQFFFVVESDQENARAMQINKDVVEYIEMKRGRMGHKWSNSDR